MQRQMEPWRICSRIGLALFLMVVAWMAGATLFSSLLSRVAPTFLATSWGLWILNDVPLYGVGLPVFLLVLRTIPDGPVQPADQKQLGVKGYLLLFLFILGATYLLNMFSVGLLTLVEWLRDRPMGQSGLEILAGGYDAIPALLFGAVVPAVGEEYIFRYLLRRKLQGAGDKTYIFFSALCFALLHGNLTQLFYAFVVGLAFAWVYQKTNKLWIPMSLHFLMNLVGLVLMPMLLAPLMEENIILTALVGGGVLLLMGVAVTIFALHIGRIWRSLRPPSEPGWPWKPPRQKAVWQPPRHGEYLGPVGYTYSNFNGGYSQGVNGRALSPPSPASEQIATLPLPEQPVSLSAYLAAGAPPSPPSPLPAFPESRLAPSLPPNHGQPPVWNGQPAPLSWLPMRVPPARLLFNLGMVLYMLATLAMIGMTLIL